MKLTATTPFGAFTRTSNTAYTHVVVRAITATHGVNHETGKIAWTPRTPESFVELMQDRSRRFGVMNRYAKDGGYVVSWHKGEADAHKAAARKPVGFVRSEFVGVYPVDAA